MLDKLNDIAFTILGLSMAIIAFCMAAGVVAVILFSFGILN